MKLIPILLLQAAFLGAPQRLKINVQVSPAQASPGDRVELRIDCEIPAGRHLYSPDFKGTGIPVRLKISGGPAEPDGALLFPEPRIRKDEILGEEVRFLEGKFRFTQPLKITAGAPVGKGKISGELSYQTCSETTCDPPGSLPISFEINVLDGAAVDEDPGKKASSSGAVKVEASIEPARMAPGGRGELVLRYRIERGAHIYSPDHKGEVGKPTRIGLDRKTARAAGEPVLKPLPTVDESIPGMPQRILRDAGEIRQPFVLDQKTGPGKALIPVTFSYMLCDDSKCLEGELRIEAVVEVAADAAPQAVPIPRGAKEATPPQPADGAGGLLGLILQAIIAGGISILMPCTYPMIPITISYFTRQAQARKASAMPLALAYGAGIILDFIIIGVLVGPLVIQFASHWMTDLVVAGVFIIFGLSLLGLFEVRLPASFNSLASKAAGATSFLGVFFLGATVVITSFACTGPFIAGILASGTQAKGLFEVIVSMFFFGLTMALPFVGLALFPAAARSLPKSGEWMHTLKVSLGFVLFASAVPFLVKMDDALELNALPRELVLYMTAGISLTATLYLLGLVRLQGEHGEVSPLRMVFGMLALVFSLYCLYGAQGNRLDSPLDLEGFLPSYSAGSGGTAQGPGHPASAWTVVEDDFEGGLARAKAEGKRALVNWTGVTCSNCRKMERSIFPRPEVLRELQKYVEVRLHTDRDNEVSKALEALKTKRLEDVSKPIYEIIDPQDGKTIDLFRGADIFGGARFREFLEKNIGR